MPYVSLLILLLLGLPSLADAQVYRCEDGRGVTFADHPCSETAQTVDIPDNRLGGRFDQNLPEPDPASDKTGESDPSATPEATSTCRFINSTDLRRYIVRQQVIPGMTRENVRRAFGSPPERYTDPQEVWIYQTRYYGALYELTYVYFRDGCVDHVEYRKP
ncbi:hypothetical protein MSNKSG1_13097 [Marinobacter santoriniensis NKSG1]|uniref:DUF4124 domain-containing protein n=1 Tax=Marinobacter santoriniensis NKSG1 TaxID=1288826 RepID=M7D2P5_9GAMM|nr:DUF4124 domain-containing protein [Marinobacter santoriniensis]EMP55013.1 hypothetical protein MSNKSG1_13097 [Marinobacter santoriniensis NKSG1]